MSPARQHLPRLEPICEQSCARRQSYFHADLRTRQTRTAAQPASPLSNSPLRKSCLLTRACARRRPPTRAQENLFSPHVDSFDQFCEVGIKRCIEALEPQEVEHPSGGPRLKFWLESVLLARPVRRRPELWRPRSLPAECRERGLSYRGQVRAMVMVRVGDAPPERIDRRLGLMPIMVRSSHCHLAGLSPEQMIAHHEEGSEMGGYFIVNGNERAIRLLIAPRRDHLMGIIRPSFKNRGADYTPYAVMVRCVRPDGTSQTVALHMLATGGATLRVTISKQEFFIPVLMLLKALRECTDAEVYKRVLGGDEADSYVSDRIQAILREHAAYEEPLHLVVAEPRLPGQALPSRAAAARETDRPGGGADAAPALHLRPPAERRPSRQVGASSSCCRSCTRWARAASSRTTPTRSCIRKCCCQARSGG